MLISLFISLSIQVILEQCPTSDEGLVLIEYFQKWCPACQKLDPVLQEIDNSLERHNVDLRIQKVDCNGCACDNNEIKSYPTLILRDDGEEIGRFTGYKTYAEVSEFLLKHTSIDKTVFEGHVEAEEDRLHELTSSNMYQGLNGPWMVYFYYKDSTPYEGLMSQLQKIYGSKINFAKISYKQSSDFINQFNIKSYPAFYGIYNGLTVPFLDLLNLNDLSKFCDKLIEPNFKNITYKELTSTIRLLDHGEPLYMVFYNDLKKANQYFSEYAHKYKYKATIYKTDDKMLFKSSSIYPTQHEPVKFGVYKDGRFYQYKGDLESEEEIATWIFHTHFKYVTEIKNSTFSTIFNGYKPAMILLTKGDYLLKEFNGFSADRHLGSPYIDMIFASIDTNLFTNFIPSLLPRIDVPSLVIYDPVSKIFRYQKFNMSPSQLSSSAMKMLKFYEQNKLSAYPPKKSNMKYYILVLGLIILGVIGISKKSKQTKLI